MAAEENQFHINSRLEDVRSNENLEVPQSPLEKLNVVLSISPRPSIDGSDGLSPAFFEPIEDTNELPFGEQLEAENFSALNDIDGLDNLHQSLPPVLDKQFQRKASTRANQFRDILAERQSGLFENPSHEQLDELWAVIDNDGNGVLDKTELANMVERYIILCQHIAKKQIQRQQEVMRRMAGNRHRRMSQTLSQLASQTQVACNQWIQRIHSNPEDILDKLMADLLQNKESNASWTRDEFYVKAPNALQRLKEALKMNEWSDRAAELLHLDEETHLQLEDDFNDDESNAKKKKRKEGILTIKVVGANDLTPEEMDGRTECSPYCILHVGNKKLPTIFLQNTNNPEWSQKFRFTRYRFKYGQPRQGTLYVMDWNGEATGASLVGFADFKIPDDYVEESKEIFLTLKDNNDRTRGYLTITLSLQPKREDFAYNPGAGEEDGVSQQ